MRFGIQHGVADPGWDATLMAPAALRSYAWGAEESGWSALSFTDHPIPSAAWLDAGGEGSADPFTSLGFCAAVTESIRLLTLALVLPYRNPLLAAHQVATLDLVSDGRLTLGVGTGYLRSEAFALGTDPRERLRDAEVALDVLTGAWGVDELTLSSDTFSARSVRAQPSPVQRPHPPLWFHGNSRWGTERAARVGQGWMALMSPPERAEPIRTPAIPDLDTLRRRIDGLHAEVERAGRRPEDVEVVVLGVWPMFDIRLGWDVEACARDVAVLEEAGVDWILAAACGDDVAAHDDTVRAFGEQVVRPLSPRP